jgi:hypothetical protein
MSLPYSATLTPSKALTIDVRSRRSERRLGMLALGGVALTTMLLSLPLWFAVTASAVVLFGFWRQGWLGGVDRLTTVSWLSDGSWILTRADRKNIPATLSAETRIGSRWLWLRWHTGCEVEGVRSGQRSMLLLKGDVLPAELRRLSVRLRLESVSLCTLAGA